MREENQIRWPQKGDNPFLVKIANLRSPTWASLKWLTTSFNVDDSSLALAFKECADKIINDLEQGTNYKHPDIYFIPIGYLYRHSLELKMKQIIRLALNLDLIKKDKKIIECLEGHSLHPLWNYVKISTVKFWPEGPKHELDAVEKTIQSFHKLDKSGQNLRYTKNSKGQPTLKNLPDSIDLVHCRDVFDGVFNLLDGCQDAFDDAFQTMCDVARDYGP